MLGTIDWLCRLPPFKLQMWMVSMRLACDLKHVLPGWELAIHLTVALDTLGLFPVLLTSLEFRLPFFLFGCASWMYHSGDTSGWRQML